MRLYIAEKPSLGRAIAEALPKPLQKGDGFVCAANGDVVSWCIGHLLEQAQPEAYDPAYKTWSHQHLPIIPTQWQLEAKKQTTKQLSILRKWVKQADSLVHAGDPDREGQLLVDEVIDFLNVSAEKKRHTQRLLINDLNLPAIKNALNNMRNNREFSALSVSALARSRADWLYGINLTRAYTLQGQQVGYRGVLSVGRVQTPILGLVVKRDNDIVNFISQPYFNVWAELSIPADKQQTPGSKTISTHFRAKWSPSEHCRDFLDEQGRNLSKALAENVIRRASFQTATVINVTRKKKQQSAPLPYNLSALQIDASKAFGLSAQQVLDICQDLYETHKAITYPRSDCRFLPTGHFQQARILSEQIQTNLAAFDTLGPLSHAQNNQELFSSLNYAQKSKAWNDSKVDAHHAIIPTLKNLKQLPRSHANVYRLICRNYLIQFLPAHVFYASQIDVTIAGGKFIAKAKEIVAIGWLALFQKKKTATQENYLSDDNDDSPPEQILPPLKVGEILESGQATIEEKHTSPPKVFTDATLLAAMTGIAHYVQDKALKKILKETDGLGTEATRAGIIELLFKRGFLQRQGKNIVSTDAGKALIEALPESTTLPDRTARWESMLSDIAERKAKYHDLMAPLEAELRQLTAQSQNILPLSLKGLSAPQAKSAKSSRYRKKTQTTSRRTTKPTTRQAKSKAGH